MAPFSWPSLMSIPFTFSQSERSSTVTCPDPQPTSRAIFALSFPKKLVNDQNKRCSIQTFKSHLFSDVIVKGRRISRTISPIIHSIHKKFFHVLHSLRIGTPYSALIPCLLYTSPSPRD
eukprot:TRINITY_DN969_c0_g3_i5.p1 TRINITY_DN969_c0_g3~~TRINITY_DN969_c0_g3_i5.p1  ORF type:complete len:119 (+),score=5.27 TRINITY_DN969_c0_g3_i5:149-505(+)